jgi:alpha-galactosidase
VLLLNKNPVATDVTVPLAQLGVAQISCPLTVTELWSGGTQSIDARGTIGGRIGAHDNLLFRIAPAPCLNWVPAGQITTAQYRFAAPPLCLQAGKDGAVTVQSCTANAAQRWAMAPDGAIRLGSGQCLDAGPSLAVATCAATPAQRFAYHRSGAITAADGRCLAVDTAKVGSGGLIGQQGAQVRLAACTTYAPEQTFSAPHGGEVPRGQ